MPTYHYKCGQCAHEFDEFQSIMDDPLTDCPECGGKIVRVITGGSGVLFKGSGFYQTDYRSKTYERAAAKDRPASVDSGSSSSDSGAKSPSSSTDKKSAGS